MTYFTYNIHRVFSKRVKKVGYFENKGDIFSEYKRQSELLDLPQKLIDKLDSLSKELSDNEGLLKSASDAFDRIFSDSADRKQAYEYLSEFEKTVEHDFKMSAKLINIFLFTAASKQLSEKYDKLKLPRDVLKATLRDIRIWCEHFYSENGEYGLKETGWLLLHFKMQLFRIGRLQYVLKKSVSDCMVFENKESGEKLMAASSGIPLNVLGEWDDNFAVAKTSFNEDETAYYVNRAQNGRIDTEKTRLLKSEWELIISENDDVLEMHIPEDGRLDCDECLESMKQAQIFFKEYFNADIKGFTVMSWLADEALAGVLSADSNIIKFQKLYDVRMMSKLGAHQTVQRVFGDRWQGDIKNAPENTSLQRRVKESMLKGVKFREYYGIRKAFSL